MLRVQRDGVQRLFVAGLAVFALMFAIVSPTFAQSTPVPGANPSTPSITLGDDQAAFAFVQASGSLVTIDVLVDDQPVLTNIAFGSVGEFLTVKNGDHTLKLVPAGGDASQALAESKLSMDKGKLYTVVAAGPSDKIEVKAFEINRDPVKAENARFRVIHAADTVDAIDIAPTDGEPIFKDLKYFNASDHADYRAGDVALQVRASGEKGSLVTLPSFQVAAGSSLDIVIANDAQGTPTALIVGVFAGSNQDGDQVASPAA